MENRYRMITKDRRHIVETPLSVRGLLFLRGLRKGRSDIFKNCRIKEVLQAYPDGVPTYTLIGTGRDGTSVGHKPLTPEEPATGNITKDLTQRIVFYEAVESSVGCWRYWHGIARDINGREFHHTASFSRLEELDAWMLKAYPNACGVWIHPVGRERRRR